MKTKKPLVENNNKEVLIKRYFRSKEMQEYLCAEDLSNREMADIILGSADSLEDKLQFVKDYLDDEENKKVIGFLSEAIDNWKEEDNPSVFLLTTKWLDEDILEEKSGVCGIFRNSSQIIEFIKREKEEETEEGEEPFEEWYEAEKWILNEEGEYEKAYSYTLIDTTVCFFAKYIFNEKLKSYLHVSGLLDPDLFDSRLQESSDLNLPIPYEVGDLIKIDCEPFAPVIPALIVEKLDNHDCCGVQILCRNEDGTYNTSALKHSHMFVDNYRSLMTPLYRLDYYNKEFDYKEELIRKGFNVINLIKEKGFGELTDEFIENC